MTRKTSFLLLFLVLLLFMLFGCTRDREQYAGKYQSGDELILELGENGTGSWSTLEDNVSFRWEIRDNQIWLHTRAGGILTGKTGKNSIDINLPGIGNHYFIKQCKYN